MLALAALLAFQIFTSALPDAVWNTPYRAAIKTEGRGPFTWKLSGASQLPSGLRLNPSTGEIFGRPQTTGSFDLTVAVNDSDAEWERTFTIRIARPLEIVTQSLPPGSDQTPYRVRLDARGGTTPVRWKVTEGKLPPGLELNPDTGVITGTPGRGGEISVGLTATDGARPPQSVTRIFSANFFVPLSVVWKKFPRVESEGIFGSVEVANDSRDDFDLTVVVVAVNEYGKAFTLGYQHFRLLQKSLSPEIPFGFKLPRGTYVAHVDAVAEVPPRTIYRARKQEPSLKLE